MVFINYLTPTWTHIWLLLQILGVERAYLSALVILGSWCFNMMRKWVTRHQNARGALLLHASDEWGTGLPIYLDFTAESFPHGAAAFLSRPSCSPADRTRYSRTGTEVHSSEYWGWILRSALRIGGYCWLKQLNLYKWTTRIIPRVESQISGMIWSSGGMRTENTSLKAISALCTQDTE